MSDVMTRTQQSSKPSGATPEQVAWLEATFGVTLRADVSAGKKGQTARIDTPGSDTTTAPTTGGTPPTPTGPTPTPTPTATAPTPTAATTPTPTPTATTPPTATPAPTVPSGEFAAKASAIEAKITALEQHAQHVHVAGEIATAKSKLQEARTKATAGDEPGAQPLLVAAEKAADDGKGFADRYAVLVLLAANANRMLNGLKVVDIVKDDVKIARLAVKAALEEEAKPAKRKYDEAERDINNAITPLKDKMKQWPRFPNRSQVVQNSG
ncbi:MAG TPA: hypothetical protein VJY39_16800 [Acidisphaera sp.]|nr:hypothetical protein [Acidisphaera sp.]